MAKKKNAPAPPIAGRLGPPPQTILRGGTHADKRDQPRGEQKRLAIREAFSFPAMEQSRRARCE
jgi:hypothetical protein